MSELRQVLSRLATKEQVIEALGLKEEQDEEFWKIQFFAVKNRFLSYLLFKLRLDLTLVAAEELDDQVEMDLISTAEDMLEQGITYSFVRDWWQNMGTYLHNRAFDAKREQDKLNKMDIVVLVFFQKGRPFYLTYQGHEPTLVEDMNIAHGFPLLSVNDLNKHNLVERAADFEAVVRKLGATHVKLLPRQKV